MRSTPEIPLFSSPTINVREFWGEFERVKKRKGKSRFAHLLTPIKRLIDYEGFSKGVLKTFTVQEAWDSHKIQGWERWRSIS